MSDIQDWSIPGADGQEVLGTSHSPDAGQPARAVVLLCHGFKGYKDYGFFPLLAESLAGEGFIAHRFNFSHSGMTNQTEKFERPELFERDTWGRQIADIRAVAKALRRAELPGGGFDLPLVWFGHSRGGVAVLLAAWRSLSWDRERRPAGLVVASAPASGYGLGEQALATLRQRGSIESPSSRTGQVLRVGKGWVDEIDARPTDFDPVNAIYKTQCPVLLVHGSADATVPVTAVRTLSGGVDKERVRVHIIQGGSHTFNAPNPMPLDADPPAQAAELIGQVVGFARGVSEQPPG